MSRIAIIPARGGSKRIPGKNIRPFLGQPIIAYSIKVALDSGLFDTVMVSTDSEEIASVAKDYGATVPFLRSEGNSGDYATTVDVVSEVLSAYKEQGVRFDTAVCIYPTAPFITPERLLEAVTLLESSSDAMPVDSVVPVVRFSFPPQRGFIIENGYTVMKQPEFMMTRTQDLEPMYHDSGQFYCLNVGAFERTHKFFMEHLKTIELDETEVQDIDNETDWILAELKYRLLHNL